MKREDTFEQQLATWLEEGPVGAPDGPVRKAIAHAHAHPRRRLTAASLWRTAMSQIQLSEVATRDNRNRSLIAAVAGVAIVAIVLVAALGSGVLTPRDGRSQVAAPVAAETTSPEAPGFTARPSATTFASPADVRGGFAVTDLVGAWAGDVLAPWTGPNWESDPSKDTTWHLTMTIDECSRGASCGTWRFATEDLGGTGKAVTCDGTLTYKGLFGDRAAFEFSEAVTSTVGVAHCQGATLVLTPFSGGTRAALEERQGGVAVTWGLVTRSTAP